MKNTHAFYLGDLRSLLREEHEEAKATMKVGTGSSLDRSYHDGVLMAYCDVQAFMDQQATDDDANYLFEFGFAIREAGERAKRDAERATWDVERSGDMDRMFHKGRLMGYYAVLSLMQSQAEVFEIPFEDLALDELNPDRDLFVP